MMALSSTRGSIDVIVVGGGPAGLSAALVLARCLRRVMVIDAGHPRNYASRAAHNYLTRDGIEPVQLLRMGREEVVSLGVEFRQGLVKSVERLVQGFEVGLASGDFFTCRKLLLATGVCDVLPDIPNLESLYGLGVHHCPYCDAYEYRGQAIAAYGRGRPALGLAQNLLTWSPNITAVTDGARLPAGELAVAAKLGIQVRDEPVARLEAVIDGGPWTCQFGAPRQAVPVEGGQPVHDRLGRIVFASGPPLEVSAMFFNTGQVQRSELPFQLGCRKDEDGGVLHDDRQRTGIPGLYLAGDASKDVQFIAVAAAEGARAGVAINGDFQAEFIESRVDAPPQDAGAALSGTRPIHLPPRSDG